MHRKVTLKNEQWTMDNGQLNIHNRQCTFNNGNLSMDKR